MNYRLIDTHSHPQLPQYDKDRGEVIERAAEKSIGIICVGTDMETSRQAIALAEAYEGMWATVGVHPNDIEATFQKKELEDMLSHSRVVAVGETGLDYYRTKDPGDQEKQRERLATQLDMAVRNDLPVIIHCREAHDDMLEMLTALAELDRTNEAVRRGVIHSYTGTWVQAQRYAQLGYLIGLNGIITFARDYDETIINMPIENILLETDAPYLSPIPHRGKRNEPLYIEEVALKVAELKRLDVTDVEKVTTSNALRLFSKVH